jgi:hypothetical protein
MPPTVLVEQGAALQSQQQEQETGKGALQPNSCAWQQQQHRFATTLKCDVVTDLGHVLEVQSPCDVVAPVLAGEARHSCSAPLARLVPQLSSLGAGSGVQALY